MDTETEIKRYLLEELGLPKEELSSDACLVRDGLLDSVNLVQLATHIERTFEIEIPDQDIDADHLDSIEMMVAYVEARQRS